MLSSHCALAHCHNYPIVGRGFECREIRDSSLIALSSFPKLIPIGFRKRNILHRKVVAKITMAYQQVRPNNGWTKSMTKHCALCYQLYLHQSSWCCCSTTQTCSSLHMWENHSTTPQTKSRARTSYYEENYLWHFRSYWFIIWLYELSSLPCNEMAFTPEWM